MISAGVDHQFDEFPSPGVDLTDSRSKVFAMASASFNSAPMCSVQMCCMAMCRMIMRRPGGVCLDRTDRD